MSGFTSPYEEDNPFADMQGSTHPAKSTSTDDKNRSTNKDETNSSPPPLGTPSESQQSESVTEGRISTPKRTVENDSRLTLSRRSGGSRKPIRASAITSNPRTSDLETDPLGPLGVPDVEEPTTVHPSQEGSHQIGKSHHMTEGLSSTVDKPAAGIAKTQGTNQGSRVPSMPLEQAANPKFSISVGDPTKIGDITSAHTVYKVYTKTTSQAFKNAECSVTRRYRDFLWLYDQLNRNSPGSIVPPVPEKQAVGRFSDDFIEARRYALERMLEKISKHPILKGDPDFKLFLESDSFSSDIKHRPTEPRIAHDSHKGFLGLGGAFSISGKFVESDEYFSQQKSTFDALEHQLKQLSKAVDVVIRQRKDLAQTTAEFGAALSALSTVELSRSLSNALGSLSDLQDKIKELHERQAQQDLLTLGHTVEEYIRLISSVKVAFSARQKAWLAWQSADAETAKRKSTGDKIRSKGRTQQDRLNAVDQEMTESERKSHQLKVDFDNIGKLLKSEIKRFDTDKVEDFRTSLEVFLESAVEAQKEVIEHWEFYSALLVKELDDDDDAIDEQVPVSQGAASNEPEEEESEQSQTNQSSVARQEDILEQTEIEPIAPTTPITPATTDSTDTSYPQTAMLPPDEANPFARESI